ncbi:ferrioxamine B transporter [Lecanicillium sp. MT-2017a]|nr:ferrioxamine B transporter [Lecanicillium sp. MT-2017a]
MTEQPLRGHASGGVSRIAAISSCMTTLDRAFIFFGVFLISFIYTLDQTIRFASQPASTADFGVHSMQATINVFRAVISAAAQPTSAKIADVFGRVELICVSIFFYVVGTIIEAAAPNVDALAAGSVIYQIGYTMIILLIEVIVGDVTSTRARLFFSYMSALPFIITTWVSGDISGALFDNNKKLWRWRWSLGMFTVIYTVSALPLILSLWFISRRAKRQGKLVDYLSAFAKLDLRSFVVQLFWLLDVVGVVLVVVVFGLILAPVTLAGGITTEWSKAKIIAPLVIGVLGIPLFITWELKGARYPLVPFTYMKDRSVWAPMGIAIVYNFTYAMNADFLYTVLLVAFDFDVKTSTRITSLYSFTGAIVGPIFGLLAYKIRRLKIITTSGTMLYTVGFGVLIHYRGMGSSQAGVIGGQPKPHCRSA